MNPQLLFAQHKTAILAGGAGLVALLALRTRKKSTSTPAATSGASGTPVSWGAPQSFTGAAYDSSTSDVYNALEQQWSQWQQQNGPKPVPAAVASSLFAPSGSTQFVRYDNGAINQVQSDGSQYNLSPDEFAKLGYPGYVAIHDTMPTAYSLSQNLTKAAK